jgi:hypothetical protein
MQWGFAGFCAVLMGTYTIFVNHTVEYLRKVQSENCMQHAKILDSLADAINAHTESSKRTWESIASKMNNQEQGISNFAEICDKLANKVSVLVMQINDHSQVMSIVRGELISAAKRLKDATHGYKDQ